MVTAKTTPPTTGSEHRRGRPSEAERQRIDERVIDAAFDIFRMNGFEAARMDKVAAAAGITKMSLYRRFPGKAELLAEVILRQSMQLHAGMPEAGEESDAIGGLKTLMWKYRERIGADRMLALQRLALTAGGEEPVRRALSEVRARYVAPVDTLVETAKARGALPRLPTEEMREILFDLLVNDAASLPLHGYPSAADQRRIFEQRWRVVEAGLVVSIGG